MKPAQYSELVAKLEQLARDDPGSLRARMFALIAVGYGYVLTILLALVAGLGILAWSSFDRGPRVLAFKLGIPLAVLAWLIAKSLWVKVEPPTGFRLASGKAPQLDQRVEEIRSALSAPHADVVLLTDDFNASVTQVPRLGIFGLQKTYLVLGVPLMMGLDPRQLDAVLAHEFAHLSGSHPKRGLWVFRMYRVWQQLLTHLEHAQSWGSKLFERFLQWYVPRMHAYGFVMSRRDEYEADADAARVTSRESMAQALIGLEVRGRVLSERLWVDVWRRAETESAPPERTWTVLPTLFRASHADPAHATWLGKALSRRALDDDTHPALADRLKALGVGNPDARFVPPLDQSAADYYLGEFGREILASMERDWRQSVAEPWKARHAELRTARERADELLARDTAGEITGDEIWELACRIDELESDAVALPYLRRAAAVMPDAAAPNFVLGRALLGVGDAKGVEHVRKAMSRDPQAVMPGSELLRQYFAEHGDTSGIADMQETQHEHAELMQAAGRERENVAKKDTLVPATLLDGDIVSLRDVAAARPRIRSLLVARKVTTLLPDRPMLIVVVEPKGWRFGWPRVNGRELATEVLEQIQLSFDADLLVLVISGDVSWLLKKIRKVPGALVYDARQQNA